MKRPNCKAYLLTIAFFVALSNNTSAQQQYSGTYFCTAEAAAGISWDPQSRRWLGTLFSDRPRYIFEMKFLRRFKDKLGGPIEFDVSAFDVSVQEHGKGKPWPCLGSKGDDPIMFSEGSILSCTGFIDQFKINPKSLRFMRVYDAGFVDGKDNSENTPAVLTGTCSKIK